jgi:hypothetical protein
MPRSRRLGDPGASPAGARRPNASLGARRRGTLGNPPNRTSNPAISLGVVQAFRGPRPICSCRARETRSRRVSAGASNWIQFAPHGDPSGLSADGNLATPSDRPWRLCPVGRQLGECLWFRARVGPYVGHERSGASGYPVMAGPRPAPWPRYADLSNAGTDRRRRPATTGNTGASLVVYVSCARITQADAAVRGALDRSVEYKVELSR